MSKKLAACVVVLALLGACHGATEHGECIGIAEDPPQPCRRYKVDTWNAVWNFIAVETVVAPVLWATSYARCPTAERKANCQP